MLLERIRYDAFKRHKFLACTAFDKSVLQDDYSRLQLVDKIFAKLVFILD